MRIIRLIASATVAFTVGCAPTTFYAKYAIRTIPEGAHVIGPNDEDWGTTSPSAVHWFESPASGCKSYEIKLVLDHDDSVRAQFDDKIVTLNACTYDGSRRDAEARFADPTTGATRVYRLERSGGEWQVAVTSDPPGASVYVGDTFLGITQKADVQPLPAKLHWSRDDTVKTLRFEKDGYQSASVSVGKGQDKANAVLQPIHAGER